MFARDIFAVPVVDQILIHAPLHDLVALVNPPAAAQLRAAIGGADIAASPAIEPLLDHLRSAGQPAPASRTGAIEDPLFLGIIPTRGCNLACVYCDFAAPETHHRTMEFSLARGVIDAYLRLVADSGGGQARVQFFGGEPFFAPEVVQFVVEYAGLRSAELGLAVEFEATTNGIFSPSQCRWIADHFDTVVLSLDGPAEVHDLHRPASSGRGTFGPVVRNAQMLSESAVNLVIRACVTEASVSRMPDFAAWLAWTLRPSTVCFESLSGSPRSAASGLAPPDPWRFAQMFIRAAHILEPFGIDVILSTADIDARHVTFCPVGKDALIVSPDGSIDACYLLEHDWRRRGLDMHLGQARPAPPSTGRSTNSTECGTDRPGRMPVAPEPGPLTVLDVDPAAVQRVRAMNVDHRPLCADCLCRFHCAGGCHVHHDTSAAPGQFDNLCIQTRLVTIARLLMRLGRSDLADAWLADQAAMEASVWQSSDRLCASSIGGGPG